MDDRQIFRELDKKSDDELLAYYVNIIIIAKARGIINKVHGVQKWIN